MAGAVFDFHELDDFNKKMVRFYSKEFPQETRKFMNKEGNEGKRILRKFTNATTTKRTGNLLRGIDKGRVHKRGEDWQVRVRNKAPHAHLIEHGHHLVAWGKPTDIRVEGRNPAARAQRAIKRNFTGDVERWIDKMLKEGLR